MISSVAPARASSLTRALLVFNPSSGNPAESNAQLAELIQSLQELDILCEVYLVQPGHSIEGMVREAVRRGRKLVIACGGDGTIDTVAGALVGTQVTLGVVPTGTRNNVARSLNIPTTRIAEAAAIVRGGQRVRVDVGYARTGNTARWFLEAATAGLASALFPAADDIQHGNLARIGDLVGTFFSYPASEVTLRVDGEKKEIHRTAHNLVIANMPYLGAAFQLAENIRYDDGKLDLLIYSNLSKLDLIAHAVQLPGGPPDDSRIEHLRVSSLQVDTTPAMPVIADGFPMGDGRLTVRVRTQALWVMAGPSEVPVPIEERPVQVAAAPILAAT